MLLTIGTWDPAWGYTWVVRGFGKVYALRSLADGSALCVADGRTLAPLGTYRTPGRHSCHITLLEHQAVVSDYTGGTLSLFPLDGDGLPCGDPEVVAFTGRGPHPERQSGPHIHSSWRSGDGRSLVVADLGCDALYRFPVREGRVVTTGRERFAMPPDCGPRHCAFGRGVLYVATELSDEVLVLSWPSMDLRQRLVTNPARPGGGGHLALSPDGRFLYVSSRLKDDGLAIFRVREDGLLDPAGYRRTGAHPRHFSLAPDGTAVFVACRDDDKVQGFTRSADDGSLREVEMEIAVESPVFVAAYEKD